MEVCLELARIYDRTQARHGLLDVMQELCSELHTFTPKVKSESGQHEISFQSS